QYWNGSDYELFENGNGPAAVNTVSLAQNSGDTTWQTGHSSAECLIADLEAEDGFGFFRVALKYTDDFGAEQFIYSDPMVVCKGTYVWPDDEVSQGVGDGYFYAYFRVDSELVDLEKVATVEFTAKSPGGTDILNELEWFTLDTDSGEISVRGQVNEDIGEEFDHFIASVKLLYTDTEVGPVTVEWEGVSSTEVILDYWEEIAPEVITAGVQANESGTAFLVSFALLMNDVDVVNATLYCCESVDGTTYYECDPALGTTWLQHDNWGDYVSIWSTYPEGECLSYNFFIPEIMPGCFYWFYIEFECWMPSGSVSYVYTDPLPAYSGSFFEVWTQYSSYAVYNPADRELRCTWGIYPNLAPELGSVTVDSVRLIPDSDEYSPIELNADCVTFIESDGSGPHFATVTVQDLALDNGPEWSLELTMSYSGGQYTWTSSGTAYVAWLNKALLKEHNSTTPQTGPAGGIS
ncbi:MAG: hypothetical protein J6P98_04755, partial [Clostridia bacterium]|nr:hypothetical protein [Clostridia bacterium]